MAKSNSLTFWAMTALGLAALVGFALAFVATRTLVATREQLQRTEANYAAERWQSARIAPATQPDEGELQRLRNENAQLRAQMRSFEMSRMMAGPGRQFGG